MNLDRLLREDAKRWRESLPSGPDVHDSIVKVVRLGDLESNATPLFTAAAQPIARAHRRSLPRTRRRLSSPFVAAAAVALLLAAFGLAFLPSQPGSNSSTWPSLVAGYRDTPRVGAHQFAYRAVSVYQVNNSGRARLFERLRLWVHPTGSGFSLGWRRGSPAACLATSTQSLSTFDAPTQAFFDQLPTDPRELDAYVRSHAAGSGTQNHAVFVAVEDMLSQRDLLASTALRAALFQVLTHTPGVTVHANQRDYLDRRTARVDFLDQSIMPGRMSSLYFDPSTYQLLAEREGPSGQPTTYAGPSPAYTATSAAGGSSPEQPPLGPARVTVVTKERVVDSVPRSIRSCR